MKKSELKQFIKEEIHNTLKEELYDFVRDVKSAIGTGNSPQTVIKYLGRRLSTSEYAVLAKAGVIKGRY